MNSRISTLLLAPLFVLLAACANRPVEQPPLQLRLIAINDFHGNLHPPRPNVPLGGAESLSTAVKAMRAGHPNHFFVAAGDLIGASPLLSALFFDEPSIESLSRMGLALSAVGNHEFDRGADELLRRQQGGCHPVDGCKGPHAFKGSGFKYLAASTIVEATGKPLLPGYHIERFEGVPVGFIGLTLKNTPNLVMPTGVKGLRFDDEVATINRIVPELQAQGVQAIVVLIHEGGYPSGGPNECPSISGPIVDIVQRMDKAVDVVVTGHTHRAYNCRIDGRLVTSGEAYGVMLSAIDLQIDRRSRDVLSSSARNIEVNHTQYPKDPEQTALLAGYVERAKPLRERVVGKLEAPLTRDADAAGATSIGQLIADSQLEATRGAGAELALMNQCGVRAGLPQRADGLVQYEDLFTSQPFGNQLITLTLSGAELLQVLADQWRDGPRSCSQLQISQGLSYSWDANSPTPQRLVKDSVRLNGQPLDLKRDYRVTVNSFMASGGDGFVTFTRGRDPRTGPVDIDALEAHVRKLGVLRVSPQDRVQRLN